MQVQHIVWDDYVTAFSIAVQSLRCASSTIKAVDADSTKKWNTFYVCRIRESVMTARVFSAVALEAYINFYADQNLGGTLAEHLDKLTPVGKWIVVTRLVTGHSIDTAKQGYQYLKLALVERNKVAHPKPKKVATSDAWDELTDLSNVINAVKAMPMLLAELKLLDSDVDDKWVHSTIGAIANNGKPSSRKVSIDLMLAEAPAVSAEPI